MREVFGPYRAPTGVDSASAPSDRKQMEEIRKRVDATSEKIGHRIKILVGKPGLDGHSNGAEQVALRARDVGMEVIYQGIRLTPEEIAESALQEDVDVVGLSILSGSHLELIPEVVRLLRDEGIEVPVVVGGIIPVADAERLRAAGVAGVYTPKDFDVNRIMGEIVELVGQRAGTGAAA
jgi:(2R)-ethylmalonyl-CoA mutase